VVAAQGGDVAQIDDPARLPQAPYRAMVESPRAGYISAIDAEQVGRASVRLGAGRARKGDAIDPAVGFVLGAKVGGRVAEGQPLVEIHARSKAAAASIRDQLLGAYTWSDEPVASPPLLLGTVARTTPLRTAASRRRSTRRA
jgi:thymidine phosphorylase